MTDLRRQLQGTLGSAYTLERELGGGGMSRVFLAEEKALGRKVVVKVVPSDVAAGVNVGDPAIRGTIRGFIAYAERRYDDAATEFRSADLGTSPTLALPNLAMAYDAANQPDSTITIFERYLATRRTRIVTLSLPPRASATRACASSAPIALAST